MPDPVRGFDLFIGVGHPFRRDDGVGPWLAQELRDRGVEAKDHAGDGLDLATALGGAGRVLIADATQGDQPPGTVVVLDALAGPLPPGQFRNSTHEFGLRSAVELARALGMLPRSLQIVGIEGQDFGTGVGLSPPVQAAASDVLREILMVLEAGAES